MARVSTIVDNITQVHTNLQAADARQQEHRYSEQAAAAVSTGAAPAHDRYGYGMAVHTALPSFGAAAAGNLEHAWHAQHPTAAAGFDAGQTTALVPLAGAGGAGDSSAGNQEQPGMYYDAEEAEQLQDAGAAALQVTASKPGKREIKNKTPPTKTHEVHIQCDSLYPQRADGRFYKIADAKSDFRPFMVMLQVPAQLHVMACMCAGCLADAQQHCAGASTKLHLLQLCFCPYLLTAYVYLPCPAVVAHPVYRSQDRLGDPQGGGRCQDLHPEQVSQGGGLLHPDPQEAVRLPGPTGDGDCGSACRLAACVGNEPCWHWC